MSDVFLEKNFLRYSVIFTEGSKGETAYLLKEGRVEISKSVEGKKKVFAILRPISLFGEMAVLLGDDKRTATAVALEDCKMVEIKKDDFQDYLRQSPPIINTVLQVLVHRLKATTQKSLRAQSPFLGAVNVLDLFAKHGVTQLGYLQTVGSLSQTLVTGQAALERVFTALEDDGMVTFETSSSGNKVVNILDPVDFAAKAMEKRKGGPL